MKANSPEVIYLIDTGDGVAWCGDPDPTGYGECDDAVKYVRGDAYEALQAECAALVEALQKEATSLCDAVESINELPPVMYALQAGAAVNKVRDAVAALAAHRKGGEV